MFFKKKRKLIYIDGMTCENCVQRVENALENLTDVSKVKTNFKKKSVIVTYDNHVDDILLMKMIEDLGYTVTGVKELT